MHLWMLLSLTAVMGAVCSESLNCSYLSLLEHLGVGSNNYSLSATRPVRNWRTPTYATVDLYLYVIIDVNEKSQSFTTGVSLSASWTNELLRWNPKDFCGIRQINVPKDDVWRPYFTIMESIEAMHSGAESAREVVLRSAGRVSFGDTYKITSTCNMDLYKFPFDTQKCQLTLLTLLNTIDQLRLVIASNSSDVTTRSLTVFQTQGEWDLISIHVSKDNLTIGPQDVLDQLVYTITIARRPQLYLINFLVPVLLFLVLDLMSFFISGSGGEKLSFKVTVLLAISVLLLILNDILPSTDQKTPVIGQSNTHTHTHTYSLHTCAPLYSGREEGSHERNCLISMSTGMFCTGVFSLVGCSIVETITVSFLMRMASKCDAKAFTWRTPEKNKGEGTNQPADSTGVGHHLKRMEDDSSLLRLILAELQVFRTHTSSHHPEHHGKTCLYLKTVAKWINAVYFILYLCAAFAFLAWIGKEWFH
ncbi:5-hydroxytryptamine receptor 3A-like isoform X1 [Alosa sapidissima]|uniref:5-hydroxytryptamine receptor 3A-like isoform X1 n=1 Tax=Alosa sapidissima TaxID=34773 RepID=UPI001C08476B|nr:5-hydroxytryptamine receptor 3A-like isoform X1 [Alosa sapidissima]